MEVVGTGKGKMKRKSWSYSIMESGSPMMLDPDLWGSPEAGATVFEKEL
jgi:hypothetical protein